MLATIVSPLVIWQSFYVIAGSAAATLTGLMFVVITLIARAPMQKSTTTIGAFGTPTVVHFCAALLIAAILNAPWPAIWQAGFALGLIGFCGVIYVTVVIWRAQQQREYIPVMEDWLWHGIFPLVAYLTLVIAALLLQQHPTLALFGIGTMTILFLFIGIHNAWDTVTYITVAEVQQTKQ